MAILRSRYSHANIHGIESSSAEGLDGVVGVFVDADLRASGIDGLVPTDEPDDGISPDHPMLAGERVHYQGQPIAVVVGEDRYVVRDAIDLIDVEYERLDAVATVTAATADEAPCVHEEAPDNVAYRGVVGERDATDEAFEAAERIVSLDLESNRVIPSAMEPRSALARWEPASGKLTVYLDHQKPHAVRRFLASAFDLPTNRVRVRVPDVGGAFGAKNPIYPEPALAAWCAMHVNRPVKWRASRTEDYLSTIHGREQSAHLEVALDDDGRMLGLCASIDAPVGAFLSHGGTRMGMNTAGILTGPYDIEAVHVEVTGLFTNTAPISSYRGAGRPEATYYLERLANAAAREIGIDPVDFRRRNLLSTNAFPHEAPTGLTYESGDYERTLDRALETIGYESLRDRQLATRETERYLGIGVSCYVDRSGGRAGDWEGGVVRMNPDGTVVAFVGTKDNGHGHETTFAQVVADELGISIDDVEVVEGDTDVVQEGRGTGGSRSTSMGGNALRESAKKLIEKCRRIAAHRFEVDPDDVTFANGEFGVQGVPDRTIHVTELAAMAYSADVPDGVESGLQESTYFSPEGRTFPYGTHVAVVEVDPGSGAIEIERFVAVDDCGVRINPALVEGQIHGGVAQAIGQAIYEHAVYDDNANLVTGSMQDYAIPRASDLPEIETGEVVTPAANNPLGVKGVGENGSIGATPAVVNAVVDALGSACEGSVDMPLTAERVWRVTAGETRTRG